jgi:glutathione S-transferase
MRVIYTCPVPSTWCPVCGKVVRTARKLGLPFERRTAWFPRSRRTEVIRLSGQNRVPIIVEDDGFVMHESRDIVAYLEKKHGRPA